MKRTLVIGTSYAVRSKISGASKRLETIKAILDLLGLKSEFMDSNDYSKQHSSHWDLIVVVSYSSANILEKARAESEFLWFDATDSWHISRLSRIKRGEAMQLAALLRDMYFIKKRIPVDLGTFISQRDLNRERGNVGKPTTPLFVLPNRLGPLVVSQDATERLVFVGDVKYGPNRIAIKFLKQIADKLPIGMDISVIGNEHPIRHSRLTNIGIVDIDDLYRHHDIHLAPIFSGAGIKNKVVEPLSLGLPVLTTNEGANGLVNLPNLYICHTENEYIETILNLRKSKERYNLVSTNPYLHNEESSVVAFIRNHLSTPCNFHNN